MVGPALRAKIYCGLCVILSCILLLAILPNIAGSVVSSWVDRILFGKWQKSTIYSVYQLY
jgi:hypothetical protein